ncbi:AzlC family ABC transporter permease [Pseudalkalibacillus decolorationis]|uniref:AzlC family ABC transporter permease n=1 Tax=Pseudalkalibacillus decolorationis TaxID=163879 RepID=UPI0027E24DB8|nr:AzlC family ABC transporter permease [Pseudalkalibacillus decolorationis]
MGISFIVFGSIFGMMAIQIGLSPFESLLMSIFSFAGSAQLSVLPMIVENSSVYAMVLTTLLINLFQLVFLQVWFFFHFLSVRAGYSGNHYI